MDYVFLAVLLGLIPASIARHKGRSFVGWWIYGALLFIAALPHSLLLEDERRRRCPFCAEKVMNEAIVCPHCQRDLAATPVAGPLLASTDMRAT